MKLNFWKKEEDLSTGELGEKLAAAYLKKRGYKIAETNFKNPFGKRLGEIDIIAAKNGEIVFVEVKTRALENFDGPLPEESITPSKLHKLNKIANFYLKFRNPRDLPYHFDAVSVWVSRDRKIHRLKHMENIFI